MDYPGKFMRRAKEVGLIGATFHFYRLDLGLMAVMHPQIPYQDLI